MATGYQTKHIPLLMRAQPSQISPHCGAQELNQDCPEYDNNC